MIIYQPSTHRYYRHKILPVFFLACLLFMTILPGNAFSCGDYCSCVPTAHGTVISPPSGYSSDIYCAGRNNIRCILRDEHQLTTDHILEEFEDMEEFLINESNELDTDRIFGGYIHPGLMMMTEQLVSTAMSQVMMIGTLFDAKQQLETQALFQTLMVEAHQDYHPSHNMCVIGTNMRSLAEAERNYEYTTFILSQRAQDRALGNMYAASARGRFDDHCFRLRQFREHYCDSHDNNDRMDFICNPIPSGSTALHTECLPSAITISANSENKDIDYMRTVEHANTLDIDFYESAPQYLSSDERNIFALASNLYSSNVIYRMPESAMRQRKAQDELLDMRTVAAKRAVAEHSFNTIVGMRAQSKTEATTDTYPYMQLVLDTMGLGTGGPMDAEELAVQLGNRPSYYAQMELLTKSVFQNPDFFVNLYDEPANVERQGVAIQAIGLMQDFDTWQSYLRTEAMLSVILELELLHLNNQVQKLMGDMRVGGIFFRS